MNAQTKKDTTIRARCDSGTKSLLHSAARQMGVAESDVLRLAIREFATRVISGGPIYAK